jgi:hypothetical protein
MELDVKTMKANNRFYRLFNKDTGDEIKFAFWANDEIGDYKVYKNNGEHILYNPKIDGDEIPTILLHGNIEFKEVK